MAPMTGRTALISGANRGIGLAIADRLAADGWNLSLGVRRPASVPDRHKGQHIARFEAEVPGSELAWVASAVDRFGCIDAIINNAGIVSAKTVIEISDADMQAMLDVPTSE